MACKENVRFSTVHIREFRLSVGDSPFVSSGPPVRLGTRKVNETVESIDKYEQLKRWRPVRKHKALMISKAERVDSLLAAGYSKQIIFEATSKALEAKRLIDESKADDEERGFKHHVVNIRRIFKTITNKRQMLGEPRSMQKPACRIGECSV